MVQYIRPTALVVQHMAARSVTQRALYILVHVALSTAGVEIHRLTVVMVAFLAAPQRLPRLQIPERHHDQTEDAAPASVVQHAIPMALTAVVALSMAIVARLLDTVSLQTAVRTDAQVVPQEERRQAQLLSL